MNFRAPFASSLVVAGLMLAVGAQAESPYAAWQQSDDDTVNVDDSFNRDYRSSVDTDVSLSRKHSEDNDTTTTVDLQFATPTLTSYKLQDQDAGHQADPQVYGAAQGHSVGVEGGTTVVSAGNDETAYYGPALVNSNVNQLPQNNLFIQGSNGAPISQANTFAGRDMGPKGVFAPVGNTSAGVSGNVGNQSGASVGQSGDSANSIADPMSSTVSR